MTLTAAPDLEQSSAEGVLRYAVDRLHPRLVVASSFQKESSVIIDMMLRIEPEVRFITLDTGVLFPETHATRRAIEERYGIQIQVYDASPPDGPAWTADRCCGEYKVAALRRALGDAEGWVTGLRREHSPERADTAKVFWDDRNGLWKFSPLADWSEHDVWRYIAEHEVPYNPLHDQGYDSIGCMPCTVPGSGRDGRWAGSDRTECGIHN